MITLLWPDGSMTTGKTWTELESAVRAAQWQPYKSRREFRQDMRRRAHLWSGKPVTAKLGRSSKAFLTSLADAGLMMIVVDDPDTEGHHA